MTDRELMQQALEALDDAVSAWRSEMEFRSCIDAAEPWAKAAEALRAAIPHSEDCWRWHHECAAIRMERIFNEH